MRVRGVSIIIPILLFIVAKTKFNRHATRNANKDPISFSSQSGTERNCSKLQRAVIEQRCAPHYLFLTTHNCSHDRATGCTTADASLGVRCYGWRHKLPKAWRDGDRSCELTFRICPISNQKPNNRESYHTTGCSLDNHTRELSSNLTAALGSKLRTVFFRVFLRTLLTPASP